MTLIRYSGKECACQCRRCGFDPWVRKMKEMATTSVFLPGKSHRSLDTGAWQVMVHGVKKKKVGHDLATKQKQQNIIKIWVMY